MLDSEAFLGRISSMCGVRSGYVARRDPRSERWTELLSFCLGDGWMLREDKTERLAEVAS